MLSWSKTSRLTLSHLLTATRLARLDTVDVVYPFDFGVFGIFLRFNLNVKRLVVQLSSIGNDYALHTNDVANGGKLFVGNFTSDL